MSLFRRNGAGHNGNTAALVATPPFAQASQAFTPDEHLAAAARAYLMYRRYLADPNTKETDMATGQMPSAEPDTPQPRKPKPPARGTAAWRKEMYRRVAEQKRAEKLARRAKGKP